MNQSLTNGQLAIVTFGRLALNIAYRIIYFLLPFLSARLEVDLQTISLLVTIQVLSSFASPLGAALAERKGERATMGWALLTFSVGAFICAISSSFIGFLSGYVLIGLSVALYQPAAQSYLSARTPYERRGWALGVLETSWAGAALIGIPPLMYLVERTRNVGLVFWILFGAALVSFLVIRYALPPTPRHDQSTQQRIEWNVLRLPSVLGMLGLLILTLAAVDLIFVIQGAWLKTSFGASETQLGQVAAMLGIAEMIGSVASTLLVDRIGKKVSVVGGFTAMALCLTLLPLSDGNWLLFLPLFFLFDLCFEYAIVSSFPLASGIASGSRATVMALTVAAIGLGRAGGSLISEPIWREFGVWTNGLLAAGLTLLGVAICVLLVRETGE